MIDDRWSMIDGLRCMAVLALLALLPAALHAQKKGATPAPACVFDTAAHTENVAAILGLRAYRNGDSVADPALTAAFGAMIQPGFKPPATIANLFYPAVSPKNAYPTGPSPAKSYRTPFVYYGLGGLYLKVDKTGFTREAAWTLPSFDQATEGEIDRQLTQADGSPEMISIGAMLGDRPARILLVADSEGSAPDPTIAPLIKVRHPELRVDSPVRFLDSPIPHYPLEMRNQGVEGVVILRFVVNESGRVDQNSLRLIGANHSQFVKPAMDAILGARFSPAKAGGCPAALMVEQVVRFTIGGRR